MDTFPTTIPGPAFPVKVKTTPKLKEVEFGDGYTASSPDGINFLRKTWSLTFENFTQAERDTLISFLESQAGRTFLWEIHSVTYKVVCKEWDEDETQPLIYTVTATFDQRFI